MQQEVKDINNFYSQYSITNIDSETQIVRSASNSYLVKLIRLEQDNANLDNVVETLQQHLTLNDQYLLTLKHYEIQTTHQVISIRSIYQYQELTLKQEIEQRKQKLVYFQSNQLWMIVYSVTRALEYLEQLNIGYGVLDCDKIFLGERIKLLDPSAIAEDPLLVTENRLYSPEVLMEQDGIDILKSDVFIFGLCLLQAALLIEFTPDFLQNFDETRLGIYLNNVDKLYQPQFGNMLRQMLYYNPDERPTFSQIKEFLEHTLELSGVDNEKNFYAAMSADSQDECNPATPLQETMECESIDIEEEECNPYQGSSLSQFEKAKMRFLIESRVSEPSQRESRISEQSRASSILNNSKTIKVEKKKVSKSIKDKLVKNVDTDLQIIEIIQYRKNGKGDDEIFTNPKLMADIQNQLKSIARHRQQGRSKENISSNNY